MLPCIGRMTCTGEVEEVAQMDLSFTEGAAIEPAHAQLPYQAEITESRLFARLADRRRHQCFARFHGPARHLESRRGMGRMGEDQQPISMGDVDQDFQDGVHGIPHHCIIATFLRRASRMWYSWFSSTGTVDI